MKVLCHNPYEMSTAQMVQAAGSKQEEKYGNFVPFWRFYNKREQKIQVEAHLKFIQIDSFGRILSDFVEFCQKTLTAVYLRMRRADVMLVFCSLKGKKMRMGTKITIITTRRPSMKPK